ncbi:hypothetical protein TVAG_205350 [Trichomonas vaginalis G3]|uniref:DUF3447 domain-containing protein n=1 Tax=Trichomonas vaginalis (strain ATCC PRA-98 / G3) TaxID=412133 RepID=A2FFR5_TRIV3|nr:spectrin binding [Trichomonas vaginalis G3]EAX96249.1 hypothetical protein TVAG_205350 [Trichomonas vaginalis G3]KAI5516243.1 spectrin binding [Trichomonas vaginalis G3]|eukprot:XP_001309179.1 hypothetical protein [Trichomonas vaginalis G3]
MSSDYSKKYEDFIGALEKLFRIKSNESIEDMCNIINKVLISKYQLTKTQLMMIITKAFQYNYSSGEIYVKILKNIGLISEEISKLTFPLEGSIQFIVIHDQIDKFKEYFSQNGIKNNKFIIIPILNKTNIVTLSLIETCAYFGSVNIFYFLISDQNYKISTKCLKYSLIGKNADIINECLKENQMDMDCLREIVNSHNFEMLQFVLDRNIFSSNDFCDSSFDFLPIFEDIIKYQNLKAVFLLFEKEKSSIIPWCAAFPQTIDIIRNERLPDTNDCMSRNIIHYACMSQNSDIFMFLFNTSYKINNNHDRKSMTALDYAAIYNNIDAAKILVSHGAEVNINLDFHCLFYSILFDLILIIIR